MSVILLHVTNQQPLQTSLPDLDLLSTRNNNDDEAIKSLRNFYRDFYRTGSIFVTTADRHLVVFR